MVPVEVMKPAEVNMGTMKTIAILNFGYPDLGYGDATAEVVIRNTVGRYLGSRRSRNSAQEQLAKYATDKFISLLVKTDYFTVMDPSNVTGAIMKADRLNLSPVELGEVLGTDALITGSITYLNANIDSKSYQKKDSKGRLIFVTTYTKKAEVTLSYRVVNSQTGQVVAVKQLKGDAAREESDPDDLPGDLGMYESILDRILSAVPRQLVPYKVTEYRALLADETKDEEMKRLDELTRKKFYADALAGYLEIWKNKRNAAAGYNAAIMLEITGDIDGAIALMIEVAGTAKNERALKEIERLNRTKAEAEAAAEQR